MSGENSYSHTRQEIGRTLERARRERGLSLEAVEQATKIRARYLRDLENERFDTLPAVYMLGSLKTYARHLGLDEAALTREFKRRQALLQERQDQAQEEPQAGESRGLFASLSRLLGAESHEAGEDEEGTVTDRVHSPRLYLSFGVVLIFVFVIALASTLRAEDQPTVSQVHETRISKFPSMIAQAGNLGDERNSGDENKENQLEKQAKSSAKVANKGEKAKTEHSENMHLTAQVSSATASASAAASAAASASSSGSVSATAKAPASERPERAATAESASAGRGVAADASAGPSARARAGPVVQRKQAGPLNATRLRNRITGQAWSVVESAW
jgi:cytoskeletal protein RodZ